MLYILISPCLAYNILSFDGGGVKSLIISSIIVDRIEDYAFDYAFSQGFNVTSYNSSKIPMQDLFDMISATSTASILATQLALEDPKWALEV